MRNTQKKTKPTKKKPVLKDLEVKDTENVKGGGLRLLK